MINFKPKVCHCTIHHFIVKKVHVGKLQYNSYYFVKVFIYICIPFRLGDILYLDFSPRRVVLSGWVGDQDPTFKGLEEALKRYIQSAWAGRSIQ